MHGDRLPVYCHEPEALWASRFEVRRAWTAIGRLRQMMEKM